MKFTMKKLVLARPLENDVSCLKMKTVELRMNVDKEANDFGHGWPCSMCPTIYSCKQKNHGGRNCN